MRASRGSGRSAWLVKLECPYRNVGCVPQRSAVGLEHLQRAALLLLCVGEVQDVRIGKVIELSFEDGPADCLSFASPERPEIIWLLAEAVQCTASPTSTQRRRPPAPRRCDRRFAYVADTGGAPTQVPTSSLGREQFHRWKIGAKSVRIAGQEPVAHDRRVGAGIEIWQG